MGSMKNAPVKTSAGRIDVKLGRRYDQVVFSGVAVLILVSVFLGFQAQGLSPFLPAIAF
jgi:hypothetical protein